MKVVTCFVCLVSIGLAAVACGSDGPLDRQGLIAAADAACTESNLAFEDSGPRGNTNDGIASEITAAVRIYDERLAALEDLQVEQSLVPAWKRYLAGDRAKEKAYRGVVKAARADDDDGVTAGFDEASKVGEARDRAARELGFEVCGKYPKIKTEKTGTGPAEDLVFVAPANDMDAAVREFTQVASTGDCVAINEALHTDATPYSDEVCSYAPFYSKGSKVLATETYGPAGVVETLSEDGTPLTRVFVVDIRGDRKLRYVTDLIHDSGGLRPAPDDNDANDVARKTVAAIRDGDAAALNRLIDYPDSDGSFRVLFDDFTTFGAGDFGKGLVSSIRSGDAEPQLLGINAAFALYFLEGDEYDYVLTFNAYAGDGSKYGFSGFYPIPKP